MYMLKTLRNFAGTLAVVFALKYYFGYELAGLSLFWVVPLGAMLVGFSAAYGYPAGMKGHHVKKNGVSPYVCLLIGVLTLVVMEYGFYYMMHVGDDMTINYQFKGIAIRSLVDDEGQAFSFWRFVWFELQNQSVTFSKNMVREIATIDGNVTFNIVLYILQGLGVILGGVLAYVVLLDDAYYCNNCKKYYSERELCHLIDQSEERMDKILELIHQKGTVENKQALVEIKKSQEHVRQARGDFKYDVILHECPVCDDGVLQFKCHMMNHKGNIQDSINWTMPLP